MLSEHIRRTHATRSRQYVFERYQNDLLYRNFSFPHLIAEACFSHTQHHDYLERLPTDQLLGQGEYANFRFVAVLLRLADVLDFDAERTPTVLFQQLGIRNAVSLAEWRKHSAITGWDIRPGYLAFAAQCPDPVIEKSIRDFLDIMEREIRDCQAVLGNTLSPRVPDYERRYNLPLPMRIEQDVGPKIGPDGPLYRFMDIGFTLDQQSIQALLMGVNLYAQPFLFFRELLQNAVDTCRHRAALHAANTDLGAYQPRISVRMHFQGKDTFLEVEDNGMGMDEAIIERFFARVGVSYYKSPEFAQHHTTNNLKFSPVSQFGIGVLSAFMVTEKLEVETRRLGPESVPLSVEIAGHGELFWLRKGTRLSPGTKLRFRLNVPVDDILLSEAQVKQDSGATAASTADRLLATIGEVAPHVEFPIDVELDTDARQHVHTWRERPPHYQQIRPRLRFVDINLTDMAPAGLNGLCTVILMEENSELVVTQPLVGDCYRRSDSIDVFPNVGSRCEYLSYMSGSLYKNIVETQPDPDSFAGRSKMYSGSTHLHSAGRWSQQGFGIPYPLFSGQAGRYGLNSPRAVSVRLLFPIWFDIDLSGDFVLPLTADRRNVLSTDESRRICDAVSELLFRLLLESLGHDTVERSAKFFQGVFERARGTFDTFESIFATYLENPR